jgi:hypothetical protein
VSVYVRFALYYPLGVLWNGGLLRSLSVRAGRELFLLKIPDRLGLLRVLPVFDLRY